MNVTQELFDEKLFISKIKNHKAPQYSKKTLEISGRTINSVPVDFRESDYGYKISIKTLNHVYKLIEESPNEKELTFHI